MEELEKLEKLLQSLVLLGWKPRGEVSGCVDSVCDYKIYIMGNKITVSQREKSFKDPYAMVECFSLNDLCSLDSKLRDFVCENKLYGNVYKKEGKITTQSPISLYYPSPISYIDNFKNSIKTSDPRYWVMMASVNEDKCVFILDNIKTITQNKTFDFLKDEPDLYNNL